MSAKDISRFLFQPQKRYSSVRMQQGRVILDSDWNESERIEDEEARRTLVETICAKGTLNEGFLVQGVTETTVTMPPALGEEFPPTKETYDFALASGSFYLGGLRFEIVPGIAERFLSQTDWLQIDADLGNLPARPSVADLTNEDGSFRVRFDLVYLRGWEQCVTAVEDSELLERALAVDTSARIYRSRRIEVLPDVLGSCAEAFAKLKVQLTAPREGDGTGESHLFDEANCELRSKAKLTITFGGEGITEDPCKPKVTAGFLGAENQTIRVQLTAINRFIWGYDNASPFYRVQVLEEGGQPVKIEFLTLPRDQAAQPLKGQAVEILPWDAFLPNQEKVAELQGHLATVATNFNLEEKTITISKPVPKAWIAWLKAHIQYQSKRDPDDKTYSYLRLWTGGSGDADEPDHAFTPGTSVEILGTGLNVTFSKHGLPGDFWIIAARPNTPDLVVPWDLMEEAPPAGTRFFFAPLALVRWSVVPPPATGGEATVQATVEDCRHKFRPLCEVGGCCTVTVGDGVSSHGDFDSIEAAIAYLPSTGGEVCLLPGLYQANVTLDRKRNIKIKGCDKKTQVIPREANRESPIFHVIDSQCIILEHMDLVTLGGTAIVLQFRTRRLEGDRPCLLGRREVCSSFLAFFFTATAIIRVSGLRAAA